LVGGAGGGAGGNGTYVSQNWYRTAGAGGGGGGALLVQTAGVFNMGPNAAIRCRGGRGGTGTGSNYTISGGPGGGGGGGSILLRTTLRFNIANPAASFVVSGGAGGTQSGSYVAPTGGPGGIGFIRIEDPNNGVIVPGGTQGSYNPMGAGVPSHVYTKWVDLGVQDPRILNWTSGDVATVTVNDAILVQVQMTREHTSLYGQPDTSAIDKNQDSLNTAIMSQWTPIKVHDETGTDGGAFGPIPGLPPNPPKEYASFDTSAALNGKGYRFVRFRIFFQLDPTQTTSSPVPYVERVTTHFQFNF
jgi:hypothetical protein